MLNFFAQAGGDLFDGSPAYLDSLKNNFKTDQATGIIEIQPAPANHTCLLFAEGTLVGSYRHTREIWHSIKEQETLFGWSANQVPIRLLTLSDVAGRAVWLALEAQPRRRLQVNNVQEWEEFLANCRKEHFTGQIRTTSASFDGLFTLWNGVLASSEAVFCTSKGFEFTPARFSNLITGPMQITLAEADLSKPSWQSCAIRLGATNWSKQLLERYRQLAGQRLLQNLSDEVNTSIRNQHWKIRFNGSDLLDYHFFSQENHARQAYLMIFNRMSERMQTILGKLLGTRIFHETFEALDAMDRRLLETTELTPVVLAK